MNPQLPPLTRRLLARAFTAALLLLCGAFAACRPIVVVTLTPTPAPTDARAQLAPTPAPQTPTLAVQTATPAPAGTPAPSNSGQGGGLVAQIIQGIILPLWNFVLDLTVGTVLLLWNETGERGGLAAQAVCCLLPLAVGGLALARGVQQRQARKK